MSTTTPVVIPLTDTGERTAVGQSVLKVALGVWLKALAMLIVIVASSATAYATLLSTDKELGRKLGEVETKLGKTVSRDDLQLMRFELREEMRTQLERVQLFCEPSGAALSCRLIVAK